MVFGNIRELPCKLPSQKDKQVTFLGPASVHLLTKSTLTQSNAMFTAMNIALIMVNVN